MANRYNNSYWNDEYHKGDAPFQFPIWAVILGFFTFPPASVAMIILNAVFGSQKRPGRPRPANRTAADPGAARYKVPPDAAHPAERARLSDERKANILFIAGGIAAALGLLAVSEPLSFFLSDLLVDGYFAWYWLEDILGGLVVLGGGIAGIVAGWFTRTNGRMRKKIANIVGDADHVYIRDIAAAVPCDEGKCIKHLENCIDKGIFGPGAYLDMRTKCLVVRGPAPQPAAKAQKPPAEKKTGNKQYQDILQELRRINDAIPDDEMSDKITRLETVSARIFQQAESNPEKLPQMRKFMDYYLPTSLKLLKTYAELDAQGVEGDNIRLSKQRIEQAMDTVTVAFENQLDQLFRTDAMDVSADIAVMENMLRADGLADSTSPAAPQSPHLEL